MKLYQPGLLRETEPDFHTRWKGCFHSQKKTAEIRGSVPPSFIWVFPHISLQLSGSLTSESTASLYRRHPERLGVPAALIFSQWQGEILSLIFSSLGSLATGDRFSFYTYRRLQVTSAVFELESQIRDFILSFSHTVQRFYQPHPISLYSSVW